MWTDNDRITDRASRWIGFVRKVTNLRWSPQALVVAMTLHERGRSILNQKKHAEALVVLLEADKEFR